MIEKLQSTDLQFRLLNVDPIVMVDRITPSCCSEPFQQDSDSYEVAVG